MAPFVEDVTVLDYGSNRVFPVPQFQPIEGIPAIDVEKNIIVCVVIKGYEGKKTLLMRWCLMLTL